MSLILDALRKSEHQRQREAGPALAVVPEGGASSRPAPWVLVLGALLLLNIIVLVALLVMDRRTERVADTPPAAAAPADAAPAVETRNERVRSAPVSLPSRPPRDEVRPLATEITEPAAGPATAQADRQASSVPAATEPAASAAPPPASAAADARLPRFADLVMRGELNVPHMHLDIHVHSAVAAERFVFINMRRYNEGQATQEGPRVERITREGVVMDYQGQQFLLARD